MAGLLPSAQTRCVADAGFFLDTPNVIGNSGHSVMRDRFFDVVDGMNSTDQLNPGCRAAGLDPRLCFFSEHALKVIKTPTFILNSLNNFMTWTILEPDPWAPGFPAGPAGWGSCLARAGEPTAESWAHCNATQRAVISGFRTAFLSAVAPALLAPHGCYLDSCPQNHEQNSGVSTLSIHNQTALATIAQWAAGKDGAAVHVVDQAFPSSTSTCSSRADDIAMALLEPGAVEPLKSDDDDQSIISKMAMARERASVDHHHQQLRDVMAAAPELGHDETVSHLQNIKTQLRLAARRSSGGAAGAVLDRSAHPAHLLARVYKSSAKADAPAGGIVHASDFADPTGVADASPGLQKAIELLLAGSGPPKAYWSGALDLSGRRLELGGGSYLLQAPLFIPGHFANFEICGGTLRAGPDFPTGKPNFLPDGEPGDSAFMLTLGNETASMQSTVRGYIESVSITDVLFQGAGIAGGGLKIVYGVGINVGPAVFVDGITGVGVRVDKGAEVLIHDSWLCGMGNPGHPVTTVHSPTRSGSKSMAMTITSSTR